MMTIVHINNYNSYYRSRAQMSSIADRHQYNPDLVIGQDRDVWFNVNGTHRVKQLYGLSSLSYDHSRGNYLRISNLPPIKSISATFPHQVLMVTMDDRLLIITPTKISIINGIVEMFRYDRVRVIYLTTNRELRIARCCDDLDNSLVLASNVNSIHPLVIPTFSDQHGNITVMRNHLINGLLVRLNEGDVIQYLGGDQPIVVRSFPSLSGLVKVNLDNIVLTNSVIVMRMAGGQFNYQVIPVTVSDAALINDQYVFLIGDKIVDSHNRTMVSGVHRLTKFISSKDYYRVINGLPFVASNNSVYVLELVPEGTRIIDLGIPIVLG